MRNREMLDRIYNAYNGYDVTIKEMEMNATEFSKQMIQSYGYRIEDSKKSKYFTMFCAWCAAFDGDVSMKEYEFFYKISKIDCGYETFRNLGLQIINNQKACVEYRDFNKIFINAGTMYDYSANIVALCMCGCDGPINSKEKEMLDKYIRHPDYNPL